MKKIFLEQAATALKLNFFLCIIIFISVFLIYFVDYNTDWLEALPNREYLALAVAAPFCAFMMAKFKISSILIAAILVVPSFYVIYFIVACSFFKDCI